MAVVIKLSSGTVTIGKGMAWELEKFRTMVEDSEPSAVVVIDLPEHDINTMNSIVFWLSKHEDHPIIDSRQIFSYEPKASDEWIDLGAREKFMASQKIIKTEKMYDCWDMRFVKLDPKMRVKLTLVAADLGVPDLLDLLCHRIAIAIRGQSVKDLKKEFDFKSVLTDKQLTDFIDSLTCDFADRSDLEDRSMCGDRLCFHMQTDDACFECRTTDLPLRKCGQCKRAEYCSRVCQKKAYRDHKHICLSMKARTDKLNQIEEEMSLKWVGFEDGSVRTLEDGCGGDFCCYKLTYPYAQAMMEFADQIGLLGFHEKSKKLVELSLERHMELLRLCHLCAKFDSEAGPFITYSFHSVATYLIILGRDKEAYNFVKYWAVVKPFVKHNFGKARTWGKGEWYYLENQDPLEDITEIQDQLSWEFLLPLVFLKGRILLQSKVAELEFKIFKHFLERDSNPLLKSSTVMEHIQKFESFLGEVEYQKQGQLFKKYLGLLKVAHPEFLPLFFREMQRDGPGASGRMAFIAQKYAHIFVQNKALMKHFAVALG